MKLIKFSIVSMARGLVPVAAGMKKSGLKEKQRPKHYTVRTMLLLLLLILLFVMLMLTVVNPRWKEALELLEEMIAEGGRAGAGARRSRPDRGVVAPSVVSYNAAISACARGRKPELALELLGDMRERSGIPPDLYSYAAALLGLAKAGRSTRALQLLDEMRGAGTAPDSVCLVAAMEACATRGSWREAGAVLEQVGMLCIC